MRSRNDFLVSRSLDSSYQRKKELAKKTGCRIQDGVTTFFGSPLRRTHHRAPWERIACAILLAVLCCTGCFSRIEGRVTAYGSSMGLSKIGIDRAGVPDVVRIFFEDLDRRIEESIWVMPGERPVTLCFAFDEGRKDLDRRALIEVVGLPTQVGQVNRLQIKANVKYQKDYRVSFIFTRHERSDGRTVFKFDDVRIVEAE